MFSLLSRPVPQGALSRDRSAWSTRCSTSWPASAARPRSSRARIDVSERNGAYEVRAELPGVKKDDIAIDIDGASVSISAKAEQPERTRKEGERVLYSERSHESYARAFELPQAVDAQAAKRSSRTAC